MRGIDKLEFADIEPELPGRRLDLGRGTDKDWDNDACFCRFRDSAQRCLVARVRDDRFCGSGSFCPCNQVIVF